jgi:uncharacterized protein DUF3800
MLKVFGDESADETQTRVFAVAGLVGHESDWSAVEGEWLRRTKGEVFHAADCEHHGNLELYKELTQILARSRVAGRAVALDLTAVREYFPGTPLDIGYYKCFIMVIQWLVDNVAAKMHESIEFTFDGRRHSEYNAKKFYESMISMPDWANRSLMGATISFASRDNPRIQMADLVAREAMKDLDNQIGPTLRRRRKSITALFTDGHFNFGVIDRNYCASWRATKDRLETEQGIGEKSLAAWLSMNGLTDNWANRICYIGFLQARSNDSK